MVWIKFKRQQHHNKITSKNSTDSKSHSSHLSSSNSLINSYQDESQNNGQASEDKFIADDVKLWKIEENLESLLHENINDNMMTTTTTTATSAGTITTSSLIKYPTTSTPYFSTSITLNGTPSFLAPLLPTNNHVIFLKNNGATVDNLFKLGTHSNNTTTVALSAAAAAATSIQNNNNNDNNYNNSSNLLIDLTSTPYDLSMTPAALLNDTNYWHINEQDFDYLYRHSFWMSMLLILAYIVVFVVGLVGNSFVISVVLRAPRMRTVTNYFIVNLAIADILVIVFCLPATLMSNIFLPWLLGWLMCKTVPYIQGVSVAASVYSLIAVSLDRLIAIWWPLKQMTKSRARFMILCIWIIALGSTIPWVLFFDLVPANEVLPGAPDMYLCQEVWPPGTNGNLYFLLAHLIACYLLPMTLITMCYILIWIKVSTRSIPGDSKDAQMDRMQQKSKVKVIKMLVAVVILFVLSWLPLYVIFARIRFGGEISIEESEILNTITPFAQWLGSSNSCINPILYAFFNNKYRRGFAAIIKSRSCCGRLRYYDNVAIASSTTSTRKSSHNSRKSPSSPGLRKNNAVSYIYEHNSLRRPAAHYPMAKQDSNLSQRMLLKQDSHGSRQMLIKQESISSDGSRRPLCQQDSNTSKLSLSKQDSVISYVDSNSVLDTKRNNETSVNNNNNSNSFVFDHKQQKFVKQDSVISFVDQRPDTRRHKLMKQDSIISFADQRRGLLNKQDSIVACSNRNGDAVTHTHHVSILKKTDSLLSSGSFTPTRLNIEIYE